MRRGLEFAGFVAVAAAVHAGVWGARAPGGSAAGGSGGQSMLTLEASGAQLAALVETWQRPVDLLHRIPDLAEPRAEPLSVAMSRPDPLADTAPFRTQAALPDVPLAPDLPQVDLAPPAPPAPPPAAPENAPETAPDIRPVARPVPETQSDPAPPRPRDTASAARPKETAKGQAGGAAGSAQHPRESPGPDAAARQSLMAEWGGQIRTRIERQKRYPRGSRATGTAQLTLTVSGEGALVSVVLRQSSGDPLLDQAALAAVRAARLPAKPPALPGDSHRFNLPVAFTR